MKTLLIIFVLSLAAIAQQPQSTSPLSAVNAKTTNGVAPGYWPTKGAGLVLNISAGTAFCLGSAVTYAGGTLTLTDNATNQVYLNTASSCVPAFKTTGFTASDVPIATVVTLAGAITTITDQRVGFAFYASGSGTVTGTGTTNRVTKWTGASVIGDSDFDNTTSNVMQATANGTDITFRGGQPGNVNSALGTLRLYGSNITGAGGASSQAGSIHLKAGTNQSTDMASMAGSIEIEPGRSTGGSLLQGILVVDNTYAKTAPVTVWNLACPDPANPQAVTNCGAFPENWLGVSDDVGGSSIQVHVPPSQTPVAASAAVTLGNTVCAGSTAGKVTDSGGVLSCTNAQGATVGTVIAVAGTFTLADGDSVTLSTTLPLVAMNTSARFPATGTVTTVTGVSPIASTGGTTPAISLQNSAAANVTAALGTDTEYFTASGSAATTGHLITGDAQGGIADSGHPEPANTTATAHQVFNTYTQSTGAFGKTQLACTDLSDAGANCQTGGAIGSIGGVMGMFLGGSAAATNLYPPWSSGGTTATNKAIMPITAAYRHLSVVSTATSSTTSITGLMFSAWPTNGIVSTNIIGGQPFPRMEVLQGSAAGAYTESFLADPFPVLKGYALNVNTENFGTSTGVALAGISWDIIGTTSQPLGYYGATGSVASSVTRYVGPQYPTGGTGSTGNATENIAGVPIPDAFTAKNFCVYVGNNQPTPGDLVGTMRYTSGGVGNDSALTWTVTANTGTYELCDATNTQALAAGDWISFKLANAAAANSAQIATIALELVPTGTATGIIVFNTATQTIASGSAKYFPAFGNTSAKTTELNAEAAVPRTMTMQNMYCLLTTNPGTNNATATLMKNGVATSVVVTLPTGGCTNNICSDTTHSASFTYGTTPDTFSIEFNQTSGTNPAVSACSIGVY